MKNTFLTLLLAMCASSLFGQSEWVNPFIGTGGHGHTYPGATAPFGMVQLSPDTRLDGWDGCGGYHYSDSAIYGFSHTHLSGTGVSDYGDLLLMPMLEVKWTSDQVRTAFSHKNEKANAGSYEVLLANDIRVELTASPRAGVHRYTFPKGAPAYLLIDLLHRDRLLGGEIVQLDEKNLKGNRRSTAWALDQNVFYHIRLSQAVEEVLADPSNPKHRKVLRFKKLKKPLTVWVGLSSTSSEAALQNMEQEVGQKELDEVKTQTQLLWDGELGKIQVWGSQEQKHIFYTALYHNMIVPNLFSDVTGSYRGMDGAVHQASSDHYTVFSLWDTYRATHPLYTLIDHERTADFLRTFERMFDQTGRLPVWELAGNETECMIGYHGASVVADAAIKGLSPLDKNKALEMVRGSSMHPMFGMEDFRKKGFLNLQDEYESVSKTLEYGYDDFCVAQIARKAGQIGLASSYDRSSLAYRNLMDEKGFMHPRSNGQWVADFDPRQVNNHFTEANSWQYSFYVPHDIQGFMKRLGGPIALEAQLDALFSADERTTGRTQADITGLIGQYAHGNEPSHHIAYLYNSAGAPHKTQQRVKQILEEMYHNAPDGLSGNEDCGQMSAWYVLSSLGFYPVCPGDPRYVIGYPALDSANIRMGNGKVFRIRRSGSGPYIDHVELNGLDHQNNFLRHRDFMQGGKLVFHMSETPSDWGTTMDRVYLTSVRSSYIEAPVMEYAASVFFDSTEVRWKNPEGHSVELSWLPKGKPDRLMQQVKDESLERFQVRESGRLELRFMKGTDTGAAAIAHFYKRMNRYTARWMNPPSAQYSAGGPDALVDGVFGDEEWRKGNWVGVQGAAFVAEVDLQSSVAINAVGLNCLQDVKSWICFPTRVAFFGKNEADEAWSPLGVVHIGDRSKEEGSSVEAFQLPLNRQLRYIRVEADQLGTLPEWHPGAGYPTYIFADEVLIIR